jgi:glutathione S-transferase
MTNTLYCFGESGNAYKASLTLELSGTPWTPRFVDFFNGEARSPEFRAINPMGEVPVARRGRHDPHAVGRDPVVGHGRNRQALR